MAMLGKLDKRVISQILKFLDTRAVVNASSVDKETHQSAELTLKFFIKDPNKGYEPDNHELARKRQKLESKEVDESYKTALHTKDANLLNKILHNPNLSFSDLQRRELETHRANLVAPTQNHYQKPGFSRLR